MNDLISFFTDVNPQEIIDLLLTNHMATGSLALFIFAMFYLWYVLGRHMVFLTQTTSYLVRKHIGAHMFLLAIFMITNAMFSVVITHDLTMLEFLEEIWIDLHLYIPMTLASISYMIVTHHLIDDIDNQIKCTVILEKLYRDNDVLRCKLIETNKTLHDVEDKIMNTPKCESNMDVVKRWLK